LGRTVLPALLPPALFLLVVLRFSPRPALVDLWRTLGATITSASGAIFANAVAAGTVGVSPVMKILAVDVGDRWRVRGWICWAWPEGSL
jgi:hypothetical protein